LTPQTNKRKWLTWLIAQCVRSNLQACPIVGISPETHPLRNLRAPNHRPIAARFVYVHGAEPVRIDLNPALQPP
jgi:hypothetical protein